MTNEEWIAALDAVIGTKMDELVDQMRELLREKIPPEKFEEWDKKARVVQHRPKS